VALSIVAVVFIAVVLVGYLARWAWTGFAGNTVWDWLHLLLLPLLVPVVIVPVLHTVLAERLTAVPAQTDPTVKDA
jgi:F0F1-type ATP synthase assembly protein I